MSRAARQSVPASAAPASLPAARPQAADIRWLRGSIAFVWLWTGLAVLHPYYRQVGHEHLARLGLPDWLMYATCIGEILLGLRVALGSAATWISALQAILMVGFTIILTWLDPMLLLDPYGALVKNLPLLAVIGTAWVVEREDWSARAFWLLRGGMASIWIIEGVLTKIVCQPQMEVDLAINSGLVPFDPCWFLRVLGACQAAGGVLLLVARGRFLQGLLASAIVALVILPLLVAWQDSLLWVHPFGPLTKNVPIIAGTWVLLRRYAAKPG